MPDGTSIPPRLSRGELWEYRFFGFSSAHSGWYPCTGGTMSADCWANLVAAGRSDSWTAAFGAQTLPDFASRVLAQAGTAHALGTSAGAESVTLVEAQLPAQSHGLTDGTATATGAASSFNGGLADPNGKCLAKTYDRAARANNLSYIAAADAGTLGTLAGVSVSGATDDAGEGEAVSVIQPTSFAGYWHVYLGT